MQIMYNVYCPREANRPPLSMISSPRLLISRYHTKGMKDLRADTDHCLSEIGRDLCQDGGVVVVRNGLYD
jgi:hypothetical protein